MNQVFLGGIALIIAFILWNSKKQPSGSTFFKSEKNSFPNSDTTYSFVQKKESNNRKASEIINHLKSKPFSNDHALNCIETKNKLTKLFSSNPNDRLLAIQIASQWGNKKAIPFLRRGLKDSDSRVVIASAAAITSFKGKTIDLKKRTQQARPPRNVSLMR
tara:strand:+ start:33 stop:515 length:483 start_codon:yes stop_codon:yes gene_type:complete